VPVGARSSRLRRARGADPLPRVRPRRQPRRAYREGIPCPCCPARVRSSRRHSLSAAHERLDQADFRFRGPSLGEGGGMARKAKAADDQTQKRAVVVAALSHIAFDGFTDRALARAAQESGVDKARLRLLFPDGPLSLVEVYSGLADTDMEERLATLDLPSMKV